MGKCGYIAVYNRKTVEIFANSSYSAQLAAIKLLNVPKSKIGLLIVALAIREDGSEVFHNG